MLPDRLSQLLTAYTDGELSPGQEQSVQRLLAHSPEARALLEQLQADAQRLRNLPRRTPGRDLAPQILQAIAAQKPLPQRRHVIVARAWTVPAMPAWAGLAVAAAVLLVVGASSYLYFTAVQHPEGERPDATQVASSTSPAPAMPAIGEEILPEPRLAQQSSAATEPGPVDLAPPAHSNDVAGNTEPRPEEPARTSPEEAVRGPDATKGILGTRVPTKPEMFVEVPDPKLALQLAMGDLVQEKRKRLLLEELQKDSAYHLELSCLNSTRAFHRLQEAFQAQGIRLVIDPGAQDVLKLGLRANYLLYTENLSSEEIARILQELAAERAGGFNRVVVNRMSADDHKNLSKLLGVDPTQLQPRKPSAPLGVDIRKPVSDATSDQVVQALNGQGAPRSEAGKPGERLAIVLLYNPTRPRQASVGEVRQFLNSRREAQPGTVQMILVLRGTNG